MSALYQGNSFAISVTIIHKFPMKSIFQDGSQTYNFQSLISTIFFATGLSRIIPHGRMHIERNVHQNDVIRSLDHHKALNFLSF